MLDLIIMPGHEPPDFGTATTGQYKEHRFNQQIALSTYLSLLDTLSVDYFEGTREEKIRFVNTHIPKLAVEIHHNRGKGGSGPEVWYYTGNKTTHKYATEISKGIGKALGLKSRGPKTNDYFWWLRRLHCPSILIEVCFLPNKEDRDKLIQSISSNDVSNYLVKYFTELFKQ